MAQLLTGVVQPDVLEVSRTRLSEPWVYDYHTRYRDGTTPLTLSDLNLVRLQHLAQRVYLQSDWMAGNTNGMAMTPRHTICWSNIPPWPSTLSSSKGRHCMSHGVVTG